ncbi:MAG TPA: AAA family ATPase [Thermoanaerobaculia bacterium]|jgi:predicted ATPase
MIPRIRQIQITHYKSIDRAVVDLEPFTALVGLNGTGKSNFLGALAFVQDCLQNPLERTASFHGGTGIFSRWSLATDPRLGIRLLIDLPDGSSADYAFQIEEKWRAQYQVVREKCSISSRGKSRVSFEVSEGKFLQEIPGIRPQVSPDRLALSAISAAEELKPLFDFLIGMRFYSIQPEAIEAVTDSVPSDSLAQNGYNAATVLKALQDNAPETHARIERLMAKAVVGIRGIAAQDLVDILSLNFSMDVGADKPTTLTAQSMSAGTLRILGILLAVYQLKQPTVLAIEEPEGTVHPAAAELITQVLADAARNRQVLITTHSPDILDSKEIRDDQIRVVTIEQGRTIIAPMSKASRQAVREHLYTPGELLRIGELGQDVEEAKKAAESLEIFESPASSLS